MLLVFVLYVLQGYSIFIQAPWSYVQQWKDAADLLAEADAKAKVQEGLYPGVAITHAVVLAAALLPESVFSAFSISKAGGPWCSVSLCRHPHAGFPIYSSTGRPTGHIAYMPPRVARAESLKRWGFAWVETALAALTLKWEVRNVLSLSCLCSAACLLVSHIPHCTTTMPEGG